jgi:hypothetical protein
MNRRRRRALLLATLVLTIGYLTVGAHAQPAAAPAGGAAGGTTSPVAPVTLPQSEYTTPTPLVINNFVNLNVANLTNDADPAGQAKSRENLSSAVFFQGAPASPAFLLVYSNSVNTAVVAKLNPKNKPSLRQRLNIAIVVARVATVSNNGSLQQATTLLINDPAEPVVLWGMKAATGQVKSALAVKIGNKLPPLVAGIVPAAMKHPSGPVVDEAYTALWSSDPDVIVELMKLWGFRLAQYQQQAPDEAFMPAADGKPVFWLTTANVWNALSPTMQVKVMQNICDQASVAAQWADQSQPGEKRDQLMKLVQQCAAGAYVVGTNIKNGGLVQASEPAAKINVQQMPQNAKVLGMVQPGLTGAIQAAFPGVKPPPAVGGNAAGAGGVAAP